jgi:hypothetical protein
MNRTTARGVTVLGTAVLVAIALAACGGGGSSSTTSSSKTSTTNAADTQGPSSATGATGSGLARRAALTACLKKYGVTLPNFGGGFGATGASGRRFPFGATGASGRRFPFGATGASGQRFPFGATGASGRPGGFPSGGFGGFAGNPKLAQALQKCGFGGFGRFGGATGRAGAFSTRIRAELTSFVACMKKNGVTLPTPNLTGTGSVFGDVDQTTAAFKAAYAQCKGILTYLNRPRRAAGATGATTG